MEPLRPEDAPGVLLDPQTADIALPADRDRLELVRDWTDGAGLHRGRRRGRAASFSSARARPYAVLSGGGLEPGLYETDGTVAAEAPGPPAPRLAVHAARRQRPPDLLREHEAHVLLDHLELGDVVGAALAEELHQPLHQLLGRAGARGDADDALALEPLLLTCVSLSIR